jgi:hypothetical protein
LKNEIRVVKILPKLTASDNEPIRCTIVTVSLDDLDATYKNWEGRTGEPLFSEKNKTAWISFIDGQLEKKGYSRFEWGEYVAISYTWGSCVETEPIILDGTLHYVPKSAYVVLKSLRAEGWFGPRVWIDYLCIDQRDETDKRQQILRMQTIFGLSWTVIVNLGEPSEDSDLAIDLINRVSYNSFRGYDYKRHLFLSKTAKAQGVPYVDQKAFSAVRKLLARPYWTRLWIIQELAMTDDTCFVYCGNSATTLHGVRIMMKLIIENLLVLEIISPSEESGLTIGDGLQASILLWYIGQLRQQSLTWKRSKKFQYFELRSRALIISQCAKATKDYDKVLGILGVLPVSISEGMGPLLAQLPVNTGFGTFEEQEVKYTRDMFIGFSVSIIEATEDLDIIFARNTFQKFQSRLELPSWVTDWVLSMDRSGTVPSNDNHFVGEDLNWPEMGSGNPLLQSRSWVATLIGRRSDAGKKGIIGFINNYKHLSCQAILVGCVEGIAPECGYEGENPEGKEPERIIQPQTSVSPYGNEKETVDALLRTLLFDPLDDCINRLRILKVPWFGEDVDHDAETGSYTTTEKTFVCVKLLAEYGWDESTWSNGLYLFEGARRHLGLYRVGGKPFKEYFPVEFTQCLVKPTLTDFDQIWMNVTNRRLITTTTGHFGLAPSIVHPEDQIFVILGCSVPVILRRCDGKKEYEVVGECWVDGFMRGEAVQQLGSGQYNLQDILIC